MTKPKTPKDALEDALEDAVAIEAICNEQVGRLRRDLDAGTVEPKHIEGYYEALNKYAKILDNVAKAKRMLRGK